MMEIKGKTIFVWKIKDVCGGDPAAIANLAVEMGITAVFVKAADGTQRYNLRPVYVGPVRIGYEDDIMGPFIEALKARGIQVWGWHYIYGEDAYGEVNTAIDRLKAFKFDGWVVDFEKEFENLDKASVLDRYFISLRAANPGILIGSTSSRYYKGHELLPWKVMMRQSEFYMPQVYWVSPTAYTPAQQLNMSYAQYRAREAEYGIDPRPYIPVGACYHEKGWQPTIAQMEEFHQAVIDLGLGAECWWEWGSAQLYDLQKGIYGLKFPTPEGEQDLSEIIAQVKALAEAVKGDQALLAATQVDLSVLRGRIGGLEEWARGIRFDG